MRPGPRLKLDDPFTCRSYEECCTIHIEDDAVEELRIIYIVFLQLLLASIKLKYIDQQVLCYPYLHQDNKSVC